jgi:serine/threonine protein phosphatase PrpC
MKKNLNDISEFFISIFNSIKDNLLLQLLCILIIITIIVLIIIFKKKRKKTKGKKEKEINKKDSQDIDFMSVIPANSQNIGKRDEQQDAFGFSDFFDKDSINKTGYIAVLADGMGGMKMGKEVSNHVVNTMLNCYKDNESNNPVVVLRKQMFKANEDIIEMSLSNNLKGQLGTTLIAVNIIDDKMYWISVGDSRVYIYRKGSLVQMTTDHNYKMELDIMVKEGRISAEYAENEPQKEALVSFIGIEGPEYIDQNIEPFNLLEDDIVLLCSDGLYGTLSDEEIKTVLDNESDLHLASELLVSIVLEKERKYQDNVTVILLKKR